MAIKVGGDTPKKKKNRKLVEVEMVGETYSVRTMKAAVAMRVARVLAGESSTMAEQLEVLDEVIEKLFGDKADDVRQRLEDDEDNLDFEHIAELMEALMGVSGEENPTG